MKNQSMKEPLVFYVPNSRQPNFNCVLAGLSRNGLNFAIDSVFEHPKFLTHFPFTQAIARLDLYPNGLESGEWAGMLSLNVSWTRVKSASAQFFNYPTIQLYDFSAAVSLSTSFVFRRCFDIETIAPFVSSLPKKIILSHAA